MRLGNGKWESTAFNSRLQSTRIGLGGSASDQSLLKLDYTYGVMVNGQLDATKNNGNIQSQTIIVPTVGTSTGFTAVQTYTYDSLNRIDDATEKIGSTEIWKQDYTFDRYGNRNFVEANTTTIPRNCLDNQTPPNPAICDGDRKIINPSVNPSNNRLSASDGYEFDAAGNTIRDPQNRKVTYDAENKQTKVETVDQNGNVTGTIGQCSYDGDGRRVKKVAWISGQWETTVFVYDASSRLVAEYSTNLNPTPQVAYLTNDHLGSPRINTNENGAVISRHDYRPYGEEITERTHAEYIADTIRKQFTGYERDGETDLDFAQARVFQSTTGRFNSADPILLTRARIVDPQQINRYAYVRNHPLLFVDPNGEDLKITITNVVVGTQRQRMFNMETRRWETKAVEVRSYRMIVENDSGTRRTFQVTRASGYGERGYDRTDGEGPSGTFIGKPTERPDNASKGFRIELTSPGQPDGKVLASDGKTKRTNIQIHRNHNDEGTSLGCFLFPTSDRERLKKTVEQMTEQDEANGFGTAIIVVVQPRGSDTTGDRTDIPGQPSDDLPVEDEAFDSNGIR